MAISEGVQRVVGADEHHLTQAPYLDLHEQAEKRGNGRELKCWLNFLPLGSLSELMDLAQLIDEKKGILKGGEVQGYPRGGVSHRSSVSMQSGIGKGGARTGITTGVSNMSS